MGFTDNKVVLLLVVQFAAIRRRDDSRQRTTATILVLPMIVRQSIGPGLDPIPLGVVIIFNLIVGLLTPPMGLSLYLVSDIAKVPHGLMF